MHTQFSRRLVRLTLWEFETKINFGPDAINDPEPCGTNFEGWALEKHGLENSENRQIKQQGWKVLLIRPRWEDHFPASGRTSWGKGKVHFCLRKNGRSKTYISWIMDNEEVLFIIGKNHKGTSEKVILCMVHYKRGIPLNKIWNHKSRLIEVKHRSDHSRDRYTGSCSKRTRSLPYSWSHFPLVKSPR